MPLRPFCQTAAFSLLALITGCGRGPAQSAAPVVEVAAASSGVQIGSAAATLASVPWPAWRGPRTNGVAAPQPLPLTWSDTENLVWRAEVPGRGHGSPVVTENLVIVPTAIQASQQQRVLAYDRRTGESKWDVLVHDGEFPDDRVIHSKGTNANSTVACDGQRIFATFFSAGQIRITALDLAGQQVWQQQVCEFISKFGYAPSPLLYRSLVIVSADHRGGGCLVAYDAATGKVAWRIQRDAVDTYSSPTVAQVGGREQLLLTGGDQLISYDPATGDELWRHECIAEATCGTVVTSPELIFASGGFPSRETVCVDANGKEKWSDSARVYEPSMAVVGEQLYAVTDDGVAFCWQGATGKLAWKKRLGGSFSASPLVCGDRIYVSDLSGKTYVFAASATEYDELAVNQLGSDCYASPAVADGQLFLRVGVGTGDERREQLVCIGAVRPE